MIAVTRLDVTKTPRPVCHLTVTVQVGRGVGDTLVGEYNGGNVCASETGSWKCDLSEVRLMTCAATEGHG